MQKIIFYVSVFSLVLSMAFGIISCRTAPPPAAEETPSESKAVSPPPPPPEPGAPVLSVSFSPLFFSPDGDGENDELFVTISCRDESPIEEWRIEIREPEPPYLLFSEWSGKGSPPAEIVWDGYSSKGELVQSATDYPFTLTVTNIYKKSSTFSGVIEVDVLVLLEGDRLRVQVPSILFGPNVGNFNLLDEDQLFRNDYILRRIALVLNKFDTYKVYVEGHANLTAPTENGRRIEQERELRPLSELRAIHVVDYLVRLGVDRSRLTPFGIGGARPVVPYEDRNNWWKNRRVEFILVK